MLGTLLQITSPELRRSEGERATLSADDDDCPLVGLHGTLRDMSDERRPGEPDLDLPPGTRVVTRPDAAALLDDAVRRTYLYPFLDRTCTLSEAARELGLPLNLMHYWVRRMLALDLIEVVEVRARAGRPVRIYRSVAPAFFVPFTVTAAETPESQLVREEVERQRRLSVLLARTQHDASARQGMLLRRKSEGTILATRFPPYVPTVPVFSSWIERPLSFEHARALQAELRALVERYGSLPSGDDATFVLRVALAPTEPTA